MSHLKKKARKVAYKRRKEDKSTKIEAVEMIFLQVSSERLTVNLKFCVGALDTAGSASHLKQLSDGGWQRRTCGGGGCSHATRLVHDDVRIVEDRRGALLAVDGGGGRGCAGQWGVARGGDGGPCERGEKVSV